VTISTRVAGHIDERCFVAKVFAFPARCLRAATLQDDSSVALGSIHEAISTPPNIETNKEQA
jgi:hypothetical protein